MNINCCSADPRHSAREAGVEFCVNRVEPFFERVDWLSFGATTFLGLLVYLLTLGPEVGLDDSGSYAAAAMYGGVPHPPGYPLWTLWCWAFIHVVPFGNIAWRATVSSAAAGALACGVIALMVSRGGAVILEYLPDGRRLPSDGQKWLRAVCGYVAGMVFGLNGAFWPQAVRVAVWPLSILLLCLVLCLLMRWAGRPEHRRYLYGAAFMYGLTLTNSQIELALAPAIPFLALIGDRKIGRDLFLIAGSMSVIGWTGIRLGHFSWLEGEGGQFIVFSMLGTIMSLMGIGLVIKTRRAFSEWKAILICSGLFLLGLSLYFYLPVASMTNPPMNWGYSRTVDGFFHVITRGQYEKGFMTNDAANLIAQISLYFSLAGREFGRFYLLLAAVPFSFLRRFSSPGRRLILGLVPPYVCLAFLMLAVLNPVDLMQTREMVKVYFSASYVVLALGLGYSLVILGSLFSRPAAPNLSLAA
jgi:hypothetical protein